MRVMQRIFRTLLVFVLFAAAGFAQAPDLPDKTPLSSWELVNNQHPKLSFNTARGRITERMRVPGGWIYQTTLTLGASVAITMTFVPDSAADAPATASKLADDKAAGKK